MDLVRTFSSAGNDYKINEVIYHNNSSDTDGEDTVISIKQITCAKCGNPTHDINKDKGWFWEGPAIDPLTIPGLVRKGKCLLCPRMSKSGKSSPSNSPDDAHEEMRFENESVTSDSTRDISLPENMVKFSKHSLKKPQMVKRISDSSINNIHVHKPLKMMDHVHKPMKGLYMDEAKIPTNYEPQPDFTYENGVASEIEEASLIQMRLDDDDTTHDGTGSLVTEETFTDRESKEPKKSTKWFWEGFTNNKASAAETNDDQSVKSVSERNDDRADGQDNNSDSDTDPIKIQERSNGSFEAVLDGTEQDAKQVPRTAAEEEDQKIDHFQEDTNLNDEPNQGEQVVIKELSNGSFEAMYDECQKELTSNTKEVSEVKRSESVVGNESMAESEKDKFEVKLDTDGDQLMIGNDAGWNIFLKDQDDVSVMDDSNDDVSVISTMLKKKGLNSILTSKDIVHAPKRYREHRGVPFTPGKKNTSKNNRLGKVLKGKNRGANSSALKEDSDSSHSEVKEVGMVVHDTKNTSYDRNEISELSEYNRVENSGVLEFKKGTNSGDNLNDEIQMIYEEDREKVSEIFSDSNNKEDMQGENPDMYQGDSSTDSNIKTNQDVLTSEILQDLEFDEVVEDMHILEDEINNEEIKKVNDDERNSMLQNERYIRPTDNLNADGIMKDTDYKKCGKKIGFLKKISLLKKRTYQNEKNDPLVDSPNHNLEVKAIITQFDEQDELAGNENEVKSENLVVTRKDALRQLKKSGKEIEVDKLVDILRNFVEDDELILKTLSKIQSLSGYKFESFVTSRKGVSAVVSVMAKLVYNVNVQVEACKALQLLAKHSHNAQEQITDEFGIDTILLSLKTHISRPELQAQAFLTLSNMLYKNEHNRVICETRNVIDMMITTISVYKDDVNVQIGAFTLFKAFAVLSTTNKAKIGTAIVHIINVIKAFKIEPTLQTIALDVLAILAENGVNRDALVTFKGLPQVISTMKVLKCFGVQYNGCLVLERMVKGSLNNCQMVVANDGIDLLFRVMQFHQDNSLMVERVFSTLAEILTIINTGSGDPLDEKVMGKLVKMVIKAISSKNHHDSPGVQGQGCFLLAALAHKNRHCQNSIAKFSAFKFIAAAMDTHSAEVVHEGGNKAIASLTLNHCSNQDTARRANVIESIINSMKFHMQNANVQVQGTAALRHISQENNLNVESILEMNGITLIAEAAHNYPQIASIQENSLACLWNWLDEKESDRKLLTSLGGVELALIAMETHKSSSAVQEHGCTLLWTIAQDNLLNQLDIALKEGVQTVMQALIQHVENACVQAQGFWLFYNLAKGNPTVQEAILEAKALDVIVAGMEEHDHNVLVQQMGWETIWMLAIDHEKKSNSQPNGVFQTILVCMKKFSDHGGLQDMACQAFHNMILSSSDNIRQIVQHGGIKYVVMAMREHSHILALQENALIVLERALAQSPVNQKNIQAVDGIYPVLKCFKKFPENAYITELAIALIIGLVSGNSENKDTIESLGGINAIVAGMRVHRGAARVQENGCRALWLLAANNPINKISIASAKGIEAIVGAMEMYPLNTSLQKKACGALWSLSYNSVTNQVAIAHCDGLSAIIKVMRSHQQTLELQEQAMRALLNLASKNEANQLRIAVEGGIDIIISAMLTHTQAPTLQEKACEVLWALSLKDDVVQIQIGNKGGIAVIVNAMNDHLEIVGVQEKALWVLLNLVKNQQVRNTMVKMNVKPVVIQAGRLFPEKCGNKVKELLFTLRYN
eukprot:CAMPEP_0194279292 /NCGR_PEP_ID=MMETSP0169-20130528/13842_1 /TAXON_ID=218684 /ORGANISM="Corethron pennatum, Strain L29A3" /LENGTH=1747 /DNA_ID=CAMNT_0039023695 /DNA_START=75 /DNA_END=5318 /DNA_ORIENTATION=+